MSIHLHVDFHATYPSYMQTHNHSLESLIKKINNFFKQIILSLFSSRLFGNPQSIKIVNEADREQINACADEATQLKLNTPDGRCIEATLLSDHNSINKTVILFSGSGNSHENFTPAMAYSYLKLGYRVLCFNYGGFGKSEGSPSQQSIELDAETVYQYVTRNLGVQTEELVVHGYSLGSYPATFLSSHYAIGKLVLDRSFNKISIAAEEVAKEKYGNLVSKIVRILVNFCAPFDNLKELRHVKGQVFIVNEESTAHFHEALINAFVAGNQTSQEELQNQGRLVGLKIPMDHEHTYDNLWFKTENNQFQTEKKQFKSFLEAPIHKMS